MRSFTAFVPAIEAACESESRHAISTVARHRRVAIDFVFDELLMDDEIGGTSSELFGETSANQLLEVDLRVEVLERLYCSETFL